MPSDTKTKPAPARAPSFTRATIEALAEMDDFDLAMPGLGAVDESKAVAHRPGGGAIPDLTGKPKVWFVMARGRSGKTMLVRWTAETAARRGGAPLWAAVDQGGRRSLADYIEGVEQPPSADPAEVARWQQGLLEHVRKHGISAGIDFGGGDTSLSRTLADVPNLAAALGDAGIVPIAVYLVGPSAADLSLLASNVAAGFCPHTLIVQNEALCDPTAGDTAGFEATVERHAVFRDAVSKGAVVVRMPRLDAAVCAYVERFRCHFGEARDGIVPDGRKGEPLIVFDREKMKSWLTRMDRRFDPIRSWLPH